MFDGSTLPLKENLAIAVKLLERFRKNDLVLEIETGVVGLDAGKKIEVPLVAGEVFFVDILSPETLLSLS